MNPTLDLPKPKISTVTAITITSPDLEISLSYYQLLGFTEVQRNDFPFKWIQVSDGALLIMLIERSDKYIALTYYVNHAEIVARVEELESAGITFTTKPKDTDIVKRFMLQTPDNLNVSLVSNIDNIFRQPPGPSMLTMMPADYANPAKYPNKVCGMFGEFAHPVADLNVSIAFWEKLGFKPLSKFDSPYPWAIISDGLAVVGLHQTKNFSEPAITFFAADMKDKIESLKAKGLEDFTENGPSNVVLTTPEKQHINLFKLGM